MVVGEEGICYLGNVTSDGRVGGGEGSEDLSGRREGNRCRWKVGEECRSSGEEGKLGRRREESISREGEGWW